MIRLPVEGCRGNGIHSGLRGRGPSEYPDMAEFLVELGIDSMSLNTDSVLKSTRAIFELEQQLGRRSPRPEVTFDSGERTPAKASMSQAS
jgi:pyruvate,water dikinase